MVGRGLWVVAVFAAVLTACGGSEGQGQVRQRASVDPTFVPGNPSCPAGTSQLKIEPVPTDETTATQGDFSVTFDIEDDGTLSFDANQGVDQVIVKGGPGANVYTYDPEVTEDSGLITPTNPNNDQPYGYSHVTFCWDEGVDVLPLEVEKTATARLVTGWTWDITKEGACPLLTPDFCPGAWNLAFRVDVSAVAGVGTWRTEGTISIRNPNLEDATLTDVEDLLDGVDVPVTCPDVAAFPHTLAGGATIECTYSAETATKPEENVVNVTTSGDVPGNSDTVAVTEGDPIAEDDCITVTDTNASNENAFPAEVCIDDLVEGSFSIEYTTAIEWAGPGSFEHRNTASFVTDDTQTTGDASFVTQVVVTCDGKEEPPPPTWPTLQYRGLSAAGTCSWH